MLFFQHSEALWNMLESEDQVVEETLAAEDDEVQDASISILLSQDWTKCIIYIQSVPLYVQQILCTDSR